MQDFMYELPLLWNGWGFSLFTLIGIVASTILTGLIGFERELHGHAAGLRTHILVAIGSSLIMSLSIYAFPTAGTRDPARLAAQVVSGIGFLGAGAIMKTGTDIRGLTTAATLWLAGGIGLSCGAGKIIEATMATVIALTILMVLRKIERRTSKSLPKVIMVIDGATPILREALSVADKYGISIKDISSDIVKYRQTDCLKVTITLKKAAQSSINAYGDELRTLISPYEFKVSAR